MFRQISTLVALALFGAGCASMRGVPKGETIVVEAVNENYYDARIHAVYAGGQRRSLGTIAGNGGRARVELPWEPRALVFEVLLVTDGATYVSQSVDFAPGESFELRVPSDISVSGFFRRVSRN